MTQKSSSPSKIRMSGALLRVPETLEQQLLAYRGRVWRIKLFEAIAIAVFGIGIAVLAVYAWDRFGDAPSWFRAAALLVSIGLSMVVPWFVYRWVWRHRALEPLAKLLSKQLPSVGDQLLGVLELTHSASEQKRSPELCQAAMDQVAKDASKRDLNLATPASRYRLWGMVASFMVLALGSIGALYPAAFANALTRLVTPWGSTPRYTFTRINPLPNPVIVAHGETAWVPVHLADQSKWQPPTAWVKIGDQKRIDAELVDGRYQFKLPPQIADQAISIQVGDVFQELDLRPTLRPELASAIAEIELPSYLEREGKQTVDTRGTRVTTVRGSQAIVSAKATRPLVSGSINQTDTPPDGETLTSQRVQVEQDSALSFEWTDHFGLSSRQPFEIKVEAIDDEAPTLICDGLPRQAVVLDSETLSFQVRANDDFGVRRVGMMWRGFPGSGATKIAKGEKPLVAGDPHSDDLEALGTFSAKSLGIEPQPIELFVWTEDYLPNRGRVYSPPHVLYVLTPDQHAVWITEQLSKWHRQALDIRDRERQLHEKNKELRSLTPDQLNQDDRRREVERQASAERSNGRRLAALRKRGDELVKTASRNPEIGVGHLERWAEMLLVLGDLSENRMPSVADLLKDASQSPTKVASTSKAKTGPTAGKSRANTAGNPSQTRQKDAKTPLRSAPQLADVESTANSPDEGKAEPGPAKKPSSPALRLPVTTVMGKSKNGKKPTPKNQQDQINQAVEEQEDLLAEFDRLADELNSVLANLEGSTLVKRLKAASRRQDLVALQLTGQLKPAFGRTKSKTDQGAKTKIAALAKTERNSVREISFIMDDLSAYFERRRMMRFKATLDEMKSTDVLGGLRELSDSIPLQQGVSVAQAEYWSDTMDRWAENLVDPACSGCCPGGKSPESLPPSIVLEVLQILEAEVSLREETRVAQQAKTAVEPEEHQATSALLSETQTEIEQRVAKVIERIQALPDAQVHFRKELAMLSRVNLVMGEAASLLESAKTGPPTIAAETEAIELILRSKRINPNGGGGGGSTPGGGNGGENSRDSALALVGKGRNEKEVRERRDVIQATGESGMVLPEEFRRGLDQYFNRLGGS